MKPVLRGAAEDVCRPSLKPPGLEQEGKKNTGVEVLLKALLPWGPYPVLVSFQQITKRVWDTYCRINEIKSHKRVSPGMRATEPHPPKEQALSVLLQHAGLRCEENNRPGGRQPLWAIGRVEWKQLSFLQI